jgi:hypothetical protein
LYLLHRHEGHEVIKLAAAFCQHRKTNLLNIDNGYREKCRHFFPGRQSEQFILVAASRCQHIAVSCCAIESAILFIGNLRKMKHSL